MPNWNSLGDEAVEILREYLRFDTTNPPGNEEPAARFLADILESAGIHTELRSSAPGRTSLVARIEGRTDDRSTALTLLNHIDVVPADPSEWSVDPFGAEERDGCLWGRGAIDMKGMGVMQLITMLAIAREKTPLQRDVVFIAVADEEAGGLMGAGFLAEKHPDLIACADVLNEGGYGMSSNRPPMLACTLSEKAIRWVRLHAHGTPGHASVPPDSSERAIDQLLAALGVIASHPPRLRVSPLVARTFRALAANSGPVRRKVLETICSPRAEPLLPLLARRMSGHARSLLSDVVTVTRLDAGYKENVVPGSATATLDCRLLPDTDPDAFLATLETRLAPHGVTVEVIFADDPQGVSDGPLLPVLESACLHAFPGVAFVPTLCPAFTDSRFFRSLGADAYGLVPVMLTDVELATFHGIDERIPIAGFRKGCEVVSDIVHRSCA